MQKCTVKGGRRPLPATGQREDSPDSQKPRGWRTAKNLPPGYQAPPSLLCSCTAPSLLRHGVQGEWGRGLHSPQAALLEGSQADSPPPKSCLPTLRHTHLSAMRATTLEGSKSQDILGCAAGQDWASSGYSWGGWATHCFHGQQEGGAGSGPGWRQRGKHRWGPESREGEHREEPQGSLLGTLGKVRSQARQKREGAKQGGGGDERGGKSQPQRPCEQEAKRATLSAGEGRSQVDFHIAQKPGERPGTAGSSPPRHATQSICRTVFCGLGCAAFYSALPRINCPKTSSSTKKGNCKTRTAGPSLTPAQSSSLCSRGGGHSGNGRQAAQAWRGAAWGGAGRGLG